MSKVNSSAQNNDQNLPPNAAALFRQLVKFYETKQYKKGIKTADSILKNYPRHGETLAMKGLILNFMKKKEESRELVKKGLSLNIKSHVCWHVYGLIYRSERLYNDAIKCYQQALKLDKENLQILKDLSNLQIQRRLLDGFEESRRQILVLKPQNRNNWIAFGVASHLAGNYDKAIDIIDKYEATDPEDMKNITYENSELYLYKNSIFYEMGNYEKALSHLESVEANVKDKISWLEMKGQTLLKLGRKTEAADIYRKLLAINSENYIYHMALREALDLNPVNHNTVNKNKAQYAFPVSSPNMQLTQQQLHSLTELYASLAQEYPKSKAVRRLVLDFFSGDALNQRLSAYIADGIRRGIPSLFRDLKPLYQNAEKLAAVERIINSYLIQLRQANRFSESDEKDSEAPSSFLWALYYVGLHYEYLGQYTQALQYVDEAIKHTPTVMDLYVLKARIFKHNGDHHRAFELMNQARTMDLQDRYLNVKCVRYAFRDNQPEEANKIVALFLRDQKDGEKLSVLHDMQVMWYEIAAGECYLRQKNYAMALKMFSWVIKHFEDINEDQFDFHTYCHRKMTLRAYLRMIRWQDNAQAHRFFFRAATNLVKAYIALYEKPEEEEKQDNDENSTAEDNKKTQKAERRKLAKQKQKETEENEKKDSKKDDSKEDEEVDPDPYGEKLVATKDPLGDATKHLRELQLHCGDRIETHLCAIELFMRKKKYLLVLQAIKRGLAIDASNPELHSALMSFFTTIDKVQSELNSTVAQVIAAERQSNELLNGKLSNLSQYNQDFLQQHQASLPHRLAVSRATLLLDPAHTSQAAALAARLDGTGINYQHCIDAHTFLSKVVKDENAANQYKQAVNTHMLYTPYFMTAEQLKVRDEELAPKDEEEKI